jgi:heme-degrading monooxygenase HmoA
VIARVWTGTTAANDAATYVSHLKRHVIPELRSIEGHRGAYVMHRVDPAGVTFVVMTLWDSIESIRRFAGDDVESAVVTPEAKAVLTSYDRRATHFEVVVDPNLEVE